MFCLVNEKEEEKKKKNNCKTTQVGLVALTPIYAAESVCLCVFVYIYTIYRHLSCACLCMLLGVLMDQVQKLRRC